MKYIGKAALGKAESMARNQANGFRHNINEAMGGKKKNEIEWK